MKYLKDKKIISLIVIFFVFTIAYFIAANKISYAFSNNVDSTFAYNIKIDIIKASALKYAEENKDLFKKDSVVYIKVQDLIDNNYLNTDSKGEIVNPLNQTETLNSNIIKLKLEDDNIEVTVDN